MAKTVCSTIQQSLAWCQGTPELPGIKRRIYYISKDQVNNNDCVYLVETVRGQFRVVGSEKWQVKSTVAQDLGQGATGTTSTTLNVEATDECPAPFYYGEIVTEDGVINEDDGGGNGGGTIIPWNPHDGLTPVDGTGGKDNGLDDGTSNLNPSNLLNPSPEGDDDGGEDPNANAAR